MSHTVYISTQQARGVMATDTQKGTITYKSSDAAALMPLLVGFKPAGKSDLGFTEPISGYKPPSADVLRQSWKLRNTETLDVAKAAIQSANTSMLFAQQFFNTKTFKAAGVFKRTAPVAGGVVVDVTDETRSNSFVAVLGRVKTIEVLIKTRLEAIKTTISANSVKMRQDTLVALKSKADLNPETKEVLSSFIQDNSVATDKQISGIFKVSGRSFEAWSGANMFDDFWSKVVQGVSNSTEVVSCAAAFKTQEDAAIEIFKKIIDEYHTGYGVYESELAKSSFRNAVITGYFNMIPNGLVQDVNTEKSKMEVDKMINDYLWNVLLERFEILDSIVSTFFSQVSSTRTAHIPSVRKFMSNAILYCLVPIFKCVTTQDTATNPILSFFANHDTKFSRALGDILGEKLTMTALDEPQRLTMRSRLCTRLVHTSNGKTVLIGPRDENSEKKSNPPAISEFVDLHLKLIPDLASLKSLITGGVRKFHDVLLIHRTPGQKLNALTAIHECVKTSDAACETAAKNIAYYSLFTDSVAYAKFHYKLYSAALKPEVFYFASVGHPFSSVVPAKAEDADHLVPDADAANQKVAPMTKDNVITPATKPSKDIYAAMTLKPDFVPISRPRPQSAKPKKTATPAQTPPRPKTAPPKVTGSKKAQKAATAPKKGANQKANAKKKK